MWFSSTEQQLDTSLAISGAELECRLQIAEHLKAVYFLKSSACTEVEGESTFIPFSTTTCSQSWLSGGCEDYRYFLIFISEFHKAQLDKRSCQQCKTFLLKETHYAHNQVCNFLLGFYWNKFTGFNAQKHCPALQHCMPSPSEMLCFSPCLFEAPS